MKRPSLSVILFAIALPLAALGAYLCVRDFNHQTNIALERRGSTAKLGALLIHEKFSGIIDVGTSLAFRKSVYQSVEKGDWDTAIKSIEGIPKMFPYIDSVGILDTEGFLKAVTPPMPDAAGKSFAYRDYYQGVIREWRPYVSEGFRRATNPEYNVVSIAVPIKSPEQKVLGILLLTIKFDAIVGWTKEVDVGPGGLIFVVDKKGQLVVHNHITPGDDLIDYSSEKNIQALLGGGSGVEVHSKDFSSDEEHVAAYSYVDDYGFGVEILQPTHIAFAERNRQLNALGTLWAFVVAVIVFFFYRILKDRAEIKEQRDRESILLGCIGDGIIAIDREWRIVLWNKAANTITGWSEKEVVGKPFRSVIKFIRENDRKENIAFIEDAIVMGKPSFMEVGTLLIKKDGSEVAVGDSAAPIIDKNGDTKGVIIVFRDTSKERERMHMRSEFVYASHQLRTPVTEALWNLDIAKKEEDPTKRSEDLGVVEQSLMSIQRLSEHLVSVSEIDQGVISVKKSPVKIVDVFDEVQKAVGVKAKDSDVTLSFGQVSMLAALNTDPRLFKKALCEVIENAIFYSPAGAEVKINTTVKEKDFLVEIIDTGVGIPEEEQPIIFTKFFRASNRPKKVAGAGLGLYIAREYVRALGGKIWFESIQGKGTTFFVLIPIE